MSTRLRGLHSIGFGQFSEEQRGWWGEGKEAKGGAEEEGHR